MFHILRRAALLFWVVFFLATPVRAATWNPNKTITDGELENYSSMSAAQIQLFLDQHGALGNYQTVDIDGMSKSAAEIIARVSRTYHLNPQFLLTLLQREQGIIDSTTISDSQLAWSTGYAICDDCSKTDPDLQQYRGFVNQLEQAGKRIRETFLTDIDQTGSTINGWGPGITQIIDQVFVTPENSATTALYIYTPHLAGNYLFWQIWQKWFNLQYPDGSLLTSNDPDDNTVWVINQGFKRPILTRAALISRFNPKNIVIATQEELARYPDGLPIRYPNYSLLRSAKGTVYLTADDTRRGFPSLRVFRALEFHEDEVIDVTDEELSAYTEGLPLAATTSYPRGSLLQDRATGGVYFVQDGIKQPIITKEIMTARFPDMSIVPLTTKQLASYRTGEPITFADGELVGVPGFPDIFVISEGSRRPIVSAATFTSMGWDWQDVIWTSEKALALHPLGDPIILDQNSDTSPVVTNF